MQKLLALSLGLALLGATAAPVVAFQEYPSIEFAPYVGFIQYDGSIPDYQTNLAWGFRMDLRTVSTFGFQFHYAISSSTGSLGSLPLGKDDYVQRIQLNLTRDLFLRSGVQFSGCAGLGRFARHSAELYDTDFSLQAGVSGRRNLWGVLYLRGDVGWTGAFLQDFDSAAVFADRTLTHNFDATLTLSFLFDN